MSETFLLSTRSATLDKGAYLLYNGNMNIKELLLFVGVLVVGSFVVLGGIMLLASIPTPGNSCTKNPTAEACRFDNEGEDAAVFYYGGSVFGIG